MAGLLVVLLQLLPVPQDVQWECEDHTQAFRTVQGHDLVFDCEGWRWWTEDALIAADGEVQADTRVMRRN